MKSITQLLSVGMLLVGTWASGDVLVEDHFDGGQIDTNTWRVVPSPYAGSSVSVVGGRAQIIARAFLNTVGDFDPLTIPGGIIITGKWTFGGSSPYPRHLHVVTRSDGIHSSIYSYTQLPANGILFWLTSDNQVSLRGLGSVMVTNVIVHANTMGLAAAGGDTVNFEVRDDGLQVIFQVVREGDPSQAVIVSADCASRVPANKITFSNREFGDTAYLDDVAVVSGSPRVTHPVTIETHPATEVCWLSESNVLYQVQQTDSIGSGQWENVGSAVVGNGDYLSVCYPNRKHNSKFFRVVHY